MNMHSLPDTLLALDRGITTAINALAGRFPELDRLVSAAIDLPLVKSVPIIALLFWLWARGGDTLRSRVLATAAASYASFALARAAAHLFPFRWRPLHDEELAFDVPAGMDPGAAQLWSSFPSDHAAMIGALAAGLWLIRPAFGALAAGWGLLFVLMPRLYVGLHYASDLAAGAAVGAAAAIVVCAARVRIPLWDASRRWAASHPPSFAAALFLGAYLLATNGDDVRRLIGVAKQWLQEPLIAS